MSKFKAGKAGDMKTLKRQMKSRGSGSGKWMDRITEDGRVVQFLAEPIEWVRFEEVYEDGSFRPVLEDEHTTNRPSVRYLTPAIDLDNGERVIALKLPVSVAQDVMRRYERRGTITDRPWELTRSGSGFDTEYFADALDPADGVDDLDVYEVPDLMAYLEHAYNEAMGIDTDDTDDDDDDEPVRPSPKKPKTKVKKGKKGKGKKFNKKLTSVQIEGMDIDELKEHLDEIGVDYPVRTRSKAVLVDLLLEHYGEESF